MLIIIIIIMKNNHQIAIIAVWLVENNIIKKLIGSI